MANVVLTLVRHHHWAPQICENLYLDGADFFGIMFFYDDIKSQNDKLSKDLEKRKLNLKK